MNPINRARSRQSVGIRVALAGIAISATTAAVVQLPTVHAAPAPAPKICTFTPAANSMPFGPVLVSTVRAVGGEVQVLHRVDCDGRTATWKWLSAADILDLS